jgi:hypothetical protein
MAGERLENRPNTTRQISERNSLKYFPGHLRRVRECQAPDNHVSRTHQYARVPNPTNFNNDKIVTMARPPPAVTSLTHGTHNRKRIGGA